jgi:hypothetical protein
MEQGYTAEEREHQVAAVQEQAKKRWTYKHRELRPRNLLLAMAQQQRISGQWLREIVEQQYADPVVSLYLTMNAEKAAAGPNALLRAFHALKTRAHEERKDYLASLSRDQKLALQHDLDEIEKLLQDSFRPENLHSLIIFRSGEELNRVAKLLVPMTDALVLDPDPYVLPLEVVLEDKEAVLLVEAEKEESRFSIYQLGFLEQVEHIKSFFPTESVRKSDDPAHLQRYRLTHLEWHLKHTADIAYHLHTQRAYDSMIVLAENRISALLDEFLHDSVKQTIIGRIKNAPRAEPRDRKQLIETILQEHRAAKEAQVIQALSDYTPGLELLCSLRDVIHACNLFLVRRLVISEDLRQPGFVCRQHHYLALEDGNCPFDGAKLAPAENIVDEIIQFARLHGVDVLVVQQQRQSMGKYAGIAAVVYPSATQALAATE